MDKILWSHKKFNLLKVSILSQLIFEFIAGTVQLQWDFYYDFTEFSTTYLEK